jgi:hypothetical protein
MLVDISAEIFVPELITHSLDVYITDFNAASPGFD